MTRSGAVWLAWLLCAAACTQRPAHQDAAPSLPTGISQKSSPDLQGTPMIPARAALVLSIRLDRMRHWIVAKLAMPGATPQKVPAAVSEIPVLRTLWAQILNGRVSGVDTARPVIAALHFGDEAAWKRSAAVIGKWARKAYEERRTGDVRPPAGSVEQRSLAALAPGFPLIRRRVIIPLVDADRFRAMVRTRLRTEISSTCAETAREAGVWYGADVPRLCPEGTFPPGATSLPFVFRFRPSRRDAAAIYVYRSHARVEFIRAAADIPGQSMDLATLLRTLRTPVKEVPLPKPAADLELRLDPDVLSSLALFSLRSQLLAMALDPARPDAKRFSAMWELVHEIPLFPKDAHFLATAARVAMDAKTNTVTITWGLSALGKKLLSSVISRRWRAFTMTELRDVVLVGRAQLLLDGPYLGKFTASALGRCGQFCRYVGLHRLALELFLPDPRGTVEQLTGDVVRRLKAAFPGAPATLRSVDSRISKDTLTLRFTFR